MVYIIGANIQATLLIDRKQKSDKLCSVMNDCRLILLLLCCLSLAVGCHATEQPQPPEKPSVNLPEPPEDKFSVPEPWQPTGRLPWKLTDSEKEKVIEIALNTPEVAEWLESQQEYSVSDISWYALWDGSMSLFSEEDVENLKVGDPHGPPNEADFYPGLGIIGDETQLQIAIDLTSETAVYISGPYPRRNGPTPQTPQGVSLHLHTHRYAQQIDDYLPEATNQRYCLW